MINFSDILDALLSCSSRKIGKTYMAAELVRKVGGVLVTFSEQSADQIRKEHGIDARSIQSMVWSTALSKPIIFDQDAFTVVIARAIKQEKELTRLRKALESVSRVADEWIEEVDGR